MSSDVAAASLGATVAFASSADYLRHAPINAISENNLLSTAWISTGMFPQEIVVKLSKPSLPSKIKISCVNVKSLKYEGCTENEPNQFYLLASEELPNTANAKGAVSVDLTPKLPHAPIQYVRIVVQSGWSSFVSIQKISVLSN